MAELILILHFVSVCVFFLTSPYNDTLRKKTKLDEQIYPRETGSCCRWVGIGWAREDGDRPW